LAAGGWQAQHSRADGIDLQGQFDVNIDEFAESRLSLTFWHLPPKNGNLLET
jgi:hypothetical protein